tara:strand:- start:450 stop:1706 length:1257 start_codon:yes stop_codon:yes gene_type:complete
MYAIIDCNNFYASCERVFNPKLNDKPVIVLSNNDGCVIARSNESKRLGIKMGVPAFKIKHIINKHNINVFSTNFSLYGDMSKRVINTISTFDIKMEIYSIDEVFLDISEFKYYEINNLLNEIKNKILKWTGIPVSIGAARTKTLAKAANYISKRSKKHKGVFIINDFNRTQVLKLIPSIDVWGIGRKLNFFLISNGINTAFDISNIDLNWIKNKTNITTQKTVKELMGESCISINNNFNKKSICTSRTFGNMVESLSDLESSITMYATRCAEKLRRQNSCATIAIVYVKTNIFRNDLPYYFNSKIINFSVPTSDTGEIISCILKELRKIYKVGFKYKKAGVILSGIVPNNCVQQDLFDTINRNKKNKIMISIDKINNKMGRDTIRYASQNFAKKYILKQQRLSKSYTTRWSQLLEIKV